MHKINGNTRVAEILRRCPKARRITTNFEVVARESMLHSCADSIPSALTILKHLGIMHFSW